MESNPRYQHSQGEPFNLTSPSAPASGTKAPLDTRPIIDSRAREDVVTVPQRRREHPYYVARILEPGVLEHHAKEEQFIIPIGSEVRFQLDAGTKISRQAQLLINKPKRSKSGGIEFTVTQPLENEEPLEQPFQGSELDTDYLEVVDPHPDGSQYVLEYRVQFSESGSFFIQVAYVDELDADVTKYSPPMYINVEPVMTLRGQEVRCKELSLMTVMTRCLGKMSRWQDVLQNASELGYNAIHFTPFQQYGESFSHYSIAGQTTIDDYFFETPAAVSREQRWGKLKSTLDGLRGAGLLSIVDIVLNHTANDSPWIVDHPEATYNTDDCPHLWSAWAFDQALQDFSLQFAQRKISECPSAPFIRNEAELAQVMQAIQKRVIGPLKVHEFFLCEVPTVMKEQFVPAIQRLEQGELEDYKEKFERDGWFLKNHFELIRDELTVGHGSGPKRFGVQLKMPEAAVFFLLVNQRNKEGARKEVERLLCQLNDDWMRRCGEYMKEAYGALEGNIRYFKTEQKQSEITKVNRIVEPYFSQLNNSKKSKVAHNGWVMGHNCMEDFGYVGWHYLRRTINIWADNIKLRYGKCPADSPYLWKHMTQYAQAMAEVADGFRLDNTHSTPIHVCQYLLQAARSRNKNLFVMAELFTSSADLDALFCQKLNLNSLVRELQNRHDAPSLGAYFHSLTCRHAILGGIDEEFQDLQGRSFKILRSRKPEDMLYDCTHDNPAVVERFQTGRMALPHIGLAAVADIAIASTWGYDLLVGEQIHCVSEKRQYCTFDQRELLAAAAQQEPEPAVKEREPPQMVEERTHFEYEFSIERAQAGTVAVAGEFNGWKPSINLTRGGGNTWRGTATLPIDRSKSQLQFKFVINGKEWEVNPRIKTTTDPGGAVNNVLDVPLGGAFQVGGSRPSAPARPDQQKTLEDIRYARLLLNRVHHECNRLNAEIFLHQQAEDVLVVTRQLEQDQFPDFDAYVSITRFCFYNKGGEYKYSTSIELNGFMSEVVFAGYLEIPDSVYSDSRLKDKNHIYGPRGCQLHSFNHLEGKFCHREKIGEMNERLNFFFMPPGFTAIIKVKSRSFVKQAVRKLNCFTADPRLDSVLTDVPQSGLNHVLFRCDMEENDISGGSRGPYGLKHSGQFPYAGIASYVHILNKLKLSRDMGAEIFDNIRAGDWLIDYTVSRIRVYQQQEPSIGLQGLADLLDEYFAAVKQLPAYLKPKFASRVIETVHRQVLKEVLNRRIVDDFMLGSEDIFVQKLALSIYQMYGRIPSVYFKEHKDSMCAGLVHFSTGYMRCWGRDTFIALRGLLIVTGLEAEARDVILFFAKVYRHGLLPNLHDGGGNTRFNSRDAPWFFLQAIKDYVLISEEGTAFLNQQFELHFRDDDQGRHMKNTRGRTLSILELIIEIVQRHCEGIDFREWNAGIKIDEHMKDPGFNVKIHCDIEKTGFCFGGNKDNCGTWMDKMGSSAAAGNKGVPATPRDGAPIELVAMQYSILSWLADLHQAGKITQQAVRIQRRGQEMVVSFADWAAKMKDNFERCFWVPADKNLDRDYDVVPKMVNRRGIYKDVYGSSDVYTDYQLRPNICIAMSYAPELFNRANAQVCLGNVARILMEKGCMGIKTLDPRDRQYNGDYDNSDDTHGFNYHQGPEWVWPVGFFLKAQLIFMDYPSKEEARQDTMKWLLPHKEHIVKDKWEGLPELTNSHGQTCHGSCVTQAWSISTIVDALRDLHYLSGQYGAQERFD